MSKVPPRPRNGAGPGKVQVKPGAKPPLGGRKAPLAQTMAYPSTSTQSWKNSAEQAPRKETQKNKFQNTNNTTAHRPTTQQTLLPLPSNPPVRSKKCNITLQKINPKDVIERKEVYKLLCENDVLITHVYDNKTGFTVKTDSPRSIDQILGDRVSNKLKSHLKLKPVPPQEYSSQKTVVVKGVDEILGGQPAEAIKEEILKNNADLRIESVIKFNGMTRTFKIICKDTATAEKICREGFKAFYYNVSTKQVEQEEHVKINTCGKCYANNAHNTNQCRSTIKICSECAETGHTWRECQATVKKCINCTRDGKEAGHRTTAMKCPLRKAIVKKVRKQKAESKKKNAGRTYATVSTGSTYAAVAANRGANSEAPKTQKPSAPPPKPVQIVMNNDLSVKMTALIMEAHIASISDGNKFSEYLSENIKLNYGVDVKFPERDSKGIFRMLSNTEQQTEEVNREEEANVAELGEQQQLNPRKRANSPEDSASFNEPKKKKNRGRKNSSNHSSTSNQDDSTESVYDSVSEKAGGSPQRASTPVQSPVVAAPSPNEQYNFKVIVTQAPKNLKGSDVVTEIFGDINPRYKLLLQSEDIREEQKIIQLLKHNRLKITSEDIQLVSKKQFKNFKPLSYQ